MNYLKQVEKLQNRAEDFIAELEQLRQDLSAEPEQRNTGERFEYIAAYLALGKTTDRKLLNMILGCTMHVVQANGAGLTLFDEQKKKLVFQAAVGDGSKGIIGYEVPLEGSRHGLAFATGEIQCSFTPIHTEVEEKTGTFFSNVLVGPLIAGEKIIGTISAVNKQNCEHFGQDDIKAFSLFSELAALVVWQQLREDEVRKIFSGETDNNSDKFVDGFVNDDEAMLVGIFQDIVKVSRNSPEMLGICKKMVEVLLSDSQKNWG
jgi:hypothetical protein